MATGPEEVKLSNLGTPKKKTQVFILGAGYQGKSTLYHACLQLLDGNYYDSLKLEAKQNRIRSVIANNLRNFAQCWLLVDDGFVRMEGIQPLLDSSDQDGTLVKDVVQALILLSSKEEVQRLLQCGDERFYGAEPENFLYLIEKLKSGFPGWPEENSPEDDLRTCIRTSGIVEEGLSLSNQEELILYDTGGQRNERKKWVSMFQNSESTDATSMFFVVSLSAYNIGIYEDRSVFALDENLALWEELLSTKWSKGWDIQLFFTKLDVFRNKYFHNKVELKKWQPTAPSVHDEQDSGCKLALNWYKELFLKTARKLGRQVEVHFVSGVDIGSVAPALLSALSPVLSPVAVEEVKRRLGSTIIKAAGLVAEVATNAFEAAVKQKDTTPWRRSKLMLVGEGAAGKSSTVRSLLGEPFQEEWDSTIGASLHQTVSESDGKVWKRQDDQVDFTLEAATKCAVERYAEKNLDDLLGVSAMQQQEATATSRKKSRFGKLRDKLALARRTKPKKKAFLSQEDKEIVSKFKGALFVEVLTDKNSGKERTTFALWDYGGQKVFYTLHHLFLTRYGIYLVVFDMRKFLEGSTKSEAVSYVKFWLNSIKLHAPGAPVLLVGTFHDQVADLAVVNHILTEELELERKFSQVHRNLDDELYFFPIDNTKGEVETMRSKIEGIANSMTFVKQKIPIQWMRCLDLLIEASEPRFSLNDVYRVAEGVGLSKLESDEMLSFFHELGVIVHLRDTANLREVVTVEPQWLVDAICRVILDRDVHDVKFDSRIDAAQLNSDKRNWLKNGVITRELLDVLWSDYNVDYLIDLLENALLLCGWNWSDDNNKKKQYLVPSMIPDKSLKDISGVVFYLDFGEYLPHGVFQRLLCLCVQYSSSKPCIAQTCALLNFDKDKMFRMDVLDCRIRVIVRNQENDRAAPHIAKLIFGMYQQLTRQVMKNRLRCKLLLVPTTVICSSADGDVKDSLLLEYGHVRDNIAAKQSGVYDENFEFVDMKDFRDWFDPEIGSLDSPFNGGLENFIDDVGNAGAVIPGKDNVAVPLETALVAINTFSTFNPLPSDLEYHCFLSHKQWSGGDAVNVLFYKLQEIGWKCWYDNTVSEITKTTMTEGVQKSACFILFMSKEIFSGNVLFEIKQALKFKKEIILVHEGDPQRPGFAHFSHFYETCPRGIDLSEKHSIQFQRSLHYSSAMMNILDDKIARIVNTSS